MVPDNRLVLATKIPIRPDAASMPLITLADPAFKVLLAVTVPDNRLVFATNIPIRPEAASMPLITLADPTFSCVLAVMVPPKIVPTTLAEAAFK